MGIIFCTMPYESSEEQLVVSPRHVCPGTGLTSHPVGKLWFHKAFCILVSDYTQCEFVLSRWLSRHPWIEELSLSFWRVDSSLVFIWFEKPPGNAFSIILMLLKYLCASKNASCAGDPHKSPFLWLCADKGGMLLPKCGRTISFHFGIASFFIVLLVKLGYFVEVAIWLK